MGKKPAFKNLFLASIIINLIEAAAIIALKNFLPPLLPLFYGRPTGGTQLTSTFGLMIAPGIAILLTVANLIVSSVVKDEFLKKILAISALAVTVLVLITVTKIIFLIGLF
jgi:hypothetical protein